MQDLIKPNADVLFEASWEVCNKVGGIFTVIQSKAGITKDNYNDYFLIGPYFKGNVLADFEESSPPKDFEKAFSELKSEGIECHFGKWLIESKPDTILIDFSAFVSRKNEIKGKLWEDYKIDSLKAGWDFEEPMCWSVAVAKLVNAYKNKNKKTVVIHCHEWLAGVALLYLKKMNPKVGTVFTTHATMLGRSIAGSGMPLYEMLPTLNPDQMAYQLGVETKYLTEKACAQTCDAFTTVSEITGMEAEKILGRKPDVLVYNGLNLDKFPSIEESLVKHRTCREKVREFIKYYFFPHYYMDIEHNLTFFIVGRYEYRNKGIDIFIEALGRVNDRLKKEKSKRTVTAFFWIPAGHKGLRMQVLENKNYFRHISNYIKYNSDMILKRITENIIASGGQKMDGSIFSEEMKIDLKKDIVHFKRSGNPPLSTHHVDENNDEIIKGFRSAGLLNRQEDNVKALLYPVYLDGNDEMINLSYYNSMAGCHLGVFCSYYEPWGYTPLESAALAVPAITSDLSGFGMFIKDKLKEQDNKGIFILNMLNVDRETQIKNFADKLYDFALLDKFQRSEHKVAAQKLAAYCDWAIMIQNYFKAHNLALENAQK